MTIMAGDVVTKMLATPLDRYLSDKIKVFIGMAMPKIAEIVANFHVCQLSGNFMPR